LAVISSWLGLALILVSGLRFAPFAGGWARLGYALAGVVALMASPIFVFTSGRAWNHDLPMLLALAAALTFLHASGYDRRAAGRLPSCPACWLATTGVLLGLAAATRLSYAFLTPAFVLALWLTSGAPGVPGWRIVAGLAVGGLVGLAPVWWALLVAPEGFLFGNVVYNLRLNPRYYAHTGGADAVTLPLNWSHWAIYCGASRPTCCCRCSLLVCCRLPAASASPRGLSAAIDVAVAALCTIGGDERDAVPNAVLLHALSVFDAGFFLCRGAVAASSVLGRDDVGAGRAGWRHRHGRRLCRRRGNPRST
jgi:hypothetical protein